jgi:hypothetical protein
MKARLLAIGLIGALLGGCALPALPTMPSMPSWVPLVGKKKEPAHDPATASAKADLIDAPKPGDVRQRPTDDTDEAVTDRIVAVVNNDAITLAELQESIVSYRAENAAQRTGPSDEELRKDFLNRLIDSRLQLQEADREKITVDDVELNEEFLERIKHYGVKTEEEFEKLVKNQGVTVDSIKKRLRDGLKVNKLVRRKVSLRVSVTEAEISQYLEENRAKLETGLSAGSRPGSRPRCSARSCWTEPTSSSWPSSTRGTPRPRTGATWAPSSEVSSRRRSRPSCWPWLRARSPARCGRRWASTSSGWRPRTHWRRPASDSRFATSYSVSSSITGSRSGSRKSSSARSSRSESENVDK